jgi:hypothetical protein
MGLVSSLLEQVGTQLLKHRLGWKRGGKTDHKMRGGKHSCCTITYFVFYC